MEEKKRLSFHNILLAVTVMIAVIGLIVASLDYVLLTSIGNTANVLWEVEKKLNPGLENYLAAVQEGKVVVYTSMPTQYLPAIISAFQAKYPGISVEYFYGPAGTLTSKLMTEIQAGSIRADVLGIGAGVEWYEVQEAWGFEPYVSDWMQPYTPGTETNPFIWRQPDGYWVTVRTLSIGFLVNTKVIPLADAPKTWADLTDPKYKGKMCWQDPDTGTSPYMMVWWLSKKLGWDYWKKMATQNIQLTPAMGDGALKVASGDVGIDIENLGYNYQTYLNAGKPVAFIYPQDGLLLLPLSMGILKNCTHPHAAKLWEDFLVSPDGQSVLLNVAGSIYTPLTGISIDPKAVVNILPKITNQTIVDFDYSLYKSEFQAMQANWTQIFRG